MLDRFAFALLLMCSFARAGEGVAPLAYRSPHAEIPAGFTIRHPVDGAEMVWVPEGYFRMGLNADTAQKQAEQLGLKDFRIMAGEESFPERVVYVQGFYIDMYEVTFERWKQFVDATQWKADKIVPTWTGPDLKPAEAKLPIASVTWKAAQEYANWSHKQLPTEAMWEKAARGTDGRWYPWGNEKPSREYGVITLKDSLRGPEPVGSYPKGASPYGCMDMAGNVYEWTSEWKEPYPNSPEPAPKPGSAHTYVALRGGSFYHPLHSYRTAKRMGFEPHETYFHVGFRTAWFPPDDFDHKKHEAK
ncbi:MAG TPA: SUMF1/EgtB/PvdO family nonheme iron enzyme [Planctomycetota bacterium]|nr:SUMF1/EgtB/PvdO family nonheme iron enzyme [Planctomycetota bacterium]